MTTIDESWHFFIDMKDVEKECFFHFEKKINDVQHSVLRLLDASFKHHNQVFNGTIDPNNDDQLQRLIEKNKQLRYNIDKKLEVLGYQQSSYETYKKDQKLLSQEIKDTHEAFLMAKKFYKKYLKIYYSIESRNNLKQIIFLQFFTDAKKDSEIYSLRLVRDTKTGNYELLNTTPKLNSFKELQRLLKDTNNVPEILCNVRQAFIGMRGKKK